MRIKQKKVVEIEREKKESQIISEHLPNNLNFSTPIIPNANTQGNKLIVGILDSNFLTHLDDLQKKYGDRILILDKNENNYTDHGELVLDTDSKNLDINDWNYYFTTNIPKGNTTYFENNIHGDFGLKKKGEGTLVLTGNNDFSKKSKVEEGIFEIYKTHIAGINIAKSGTLTLHNDAIVGYIKYDTGEENFSPVANEGKLKLTGNRTFVGEYQNNGGVLTLPQGAKLTVLKDANIDNLAITLEANKYISSVQEKAKILEAKTIVGEIGSVNINGMRIISLEKDQDKLVASIARENAVSYLGDADETSKNTAEKMEATLKELDEKYQKGLLTTDEKELGSTILTMSNDTFKTSTEIVSGEI